MIGNSVLEAHRLAVGYRHGRRKKSVLTGIDLSVAEGELVCVLGPNGIGKSTLLRTLAGLQPILAGTVLIHGHDLTAFRPADRARLVGVVLPEQIGVGALRGWQMVALGRFAHTGWFGRLERKDLAAVDRALDAAGASHLADRDCRELSDGERQRLNIARVLAQQPRLIILDEPTAFLDISARVDLIELLRRLARKDGLAVIASTHDLDLALRNADTAWLVAPDRGLRIGTPEDLIAAGELGETFATREMAFDPQSLGFRTNRTGGASVAISGAAPHVQLARAVAEREGLRVLAAGSAEVPAIALTINAGLWRAFHGGNDVSGSSFAALATFLRATAKQPQPQPQPLPVPPAKSIGG